MTYLGDYEEDMRRLGVVDLEKVPSGSDVWRPYQEPCEPWEELWERWTWWPKEQEKEKDPYWFFDDYNLELPHSRHGCCNLQDATINLLEYGALSPAFQPGSVVRVLTVQGDYARRMGIVLEVHLFPSQEPGQADRYEYTVLVSTNKIRISQGLLMRT